MDSRIEALATRPARYQTTRESWTHVFHNWRACISIVVAAVALVAGSFVAHGQSGAGSIQGTVSDSTGAVIPGASVHVVNGDNGVTADTKTNGVGFYLVPGLFTGTYSVRISSPGMKTYLQTFDLQANQIGVVNVKMTPGAVTEQVTVNANTIQMIETEQGTISETLDNTRINQLPENGRYLQTLVTETTPGIECNGPCNNPGGFGGQSRANGTMPEAMEYEADGVPMVNMNFGGQNNVYGGTLPDPDSVQEVAVVAAVADAKLALPSTAEITTKSGTNSLHGTLFSTMRNNAVGIAKSRSNPYNYSAPEYIRNEFGASAGGPIIVPWLYHGKNKSFWFFAYERFSLAQVSFNNGAVPTVAERGGDFSNATTTAGLQTVYDPSTTAPNTGGCVNNVGVTYAGLAQWCRTQYNYNGKANVINPSLESPAAKVIFGITPLPTANDQPLAVSGGTNIQIPNKSIQITPTVTFRLDHVFNENNKVYLRYSDNYENQDGLRSGTSAGTIASSGIPVGASGYQIIPVTTFATALGYTHVFSPSFFSETVVSQQWLRQVVGGQAIPNLDYHGILGMPNNFASPGFPGISGLNDGPNLGGNMFNYEENQIISQIDENLTKTIGKHQTEFGGRYRHERLYYLNSRYGDTAYFGGGQTTGLQNPGSGTSLSAWANTGFANADGFLGGAYKYLVYLEPPPSWFIDQEYDAYAQDYYHARRNLTVDIGLRYEAHPARTTRGQVDNSIDLKTHAMVLGAPISQLISEGWTTQGIINNMEQIGVSFETPTQAGMPSTLYDSSDIVLSPRIGLAWQPFGVGRGTVLRGGYGKYIYPMPTRNSNPGPTSLPFTYGFTQDYSSATQTPDSLPNYNLRSMQNGSNAYSTLTPSGTGTPIMGTNAKNVINSNTTNGAITPGITGEFFNPDHKPDMVTEMDATLEQALKGDAAVRISWVWSHGTNLDDAFYLDYAPAAYGWEVNTGTPPPQGGASTIGTNQYAATATNPWDNIDYAGTTGFIWSQKNGWSNDNALQVNYQRQFHHGYGYQFIYVWSRPFRLGGNSTRDGNIYDYGSFATGAQATTTSLAGESPITPGALPPPPAGGAPSWSEYKALQKFEQYQIDTAIPQQHIEFNGIVDLPVGRGKKFLGNSNRFVDELIGGFQLAGDGNIMSQGFFPGAGNYGPNNPLKIYKKSQQTITDCSSGVCHPDFLWFKGYISPKLLTPGNGGTCTTNCVTGLPSDYVPYQIPIDNNPALANFGTNNVQVSSTAINASNKGTPVTVAYSPGFAGSNLYSHTFIRGPVNFNYDLSLFKVFPITERTNLRVNLDAFNAFNQQGLPNPGGTNGELGIQPGVAGGGSSYWTPRQLQLTMRLTF
jgi:hypothetical protein